MIDKELLDILACPACKADVVLETVSGQEKIACTKCKRKYPVRDGIPIMLIDEAEQA
ncbi:MAG TPA: hypothetical protein DCL49_10925 [Candidatus Omnitrophica bacterium]|nr:hypothetical protein [Candidatus Omnitrophota bacterium]HBG64683.1 hypothetical protein [Candidatus Omnitrophota bacterium]HCD39244.1 hypothetical protein [Candidatus Omnitrophota bacterium]